jgi:hypothetical protein
VVRLDCPGFAPAQIRASRGKMEARRLSRLKNCRCCVRLEGNAPPLRVVRRLEVDLFPLLALTFVLGFPQCGLLRLWIAARKLRSSTEGFFLGFVLGPVGVIIEVALPDEWPRGAKK